MNQDEMAVKQARYEELCKKEDLWIDHKGEMSDAELNEKIRLFYELDPSRIHWDQDKIGTPKDIWP